MTTNAVIRVHQHGGPECLRLDEFPLESLQPDQLLIEVEAAGVNFFDTQLRSGLYKQTLPIALGNEGAGVVREVGSSVTGFKAGDRVAWAQSTASYARWKTIAASQVFALPDGVSCEAAAAVLFQGMTAHYLGCSTYPLKAGETFPLTLQFEHAPPMTVTVTVEPVGEFELKGIRRPIAAYNVLAATPKI